MAKKINSHLLQIVNLLNDGRFHTGNAIGKQLKMTRSAVWKFIQQLKQYDVDVRAAKGRGYQLLSPFTLIEHDQIKKKLDRKDVTLAVFESIGSTNEYLKSLKNITAPIICIAEHQSHGKARLDRTWYSPFGKNIYLSCRYPFYKDVSELAGLSLLSGLAVYKTLQGLGLPQGLSVKWPNDIYFDYQKLCGILLEVQSESQDGLSHAIIGIGMNVNLQADNQCISQAWTSLQTILQRPLDRNEICSQLINRLLDYLHTFEKVGFAPFLDEWQKADCLYHKKITLKTMTHQVTGIVRGINEGGQLLLESGQGYLQAFSSGDVTIEKS